MLLLALSCAGYDRMDTTSIIDPPLNDMEAVELGESSSIAPLAAPLDPSDLEKVARENSDTSTDAAAANPEDAAKNRNATTQQNETMNFHGSNVQPDEFQVRVQSQLTGVNNALELMAPGDNNTQTASNNTEI